MSSPGGKGRAVLWGLFDEGAHPTHEGSALKTETPSKGPTSQYHFLGELDSTFSLGRSRSRVLPYNLRTNGVLQISTDYGRSALLIILH